MRYYSWAFLTFQNLGILEIISRYYNQTCNLPIMKFYEVFLEFCRNVKSLFSDEFAKVVEHIELGYSGKGWDHSDPKLGDIIWPIEEATWLRLTYDETQLRNGIRLFLPYLENSLKLKTPKKILDDLIKFQLFLLTTRNFQSEIKSKSFNYDWKNYFVHNDSLKQMPKTYYYKNMVIEKDSIKWGYKTIWYGRRSSHFKCNPESIHEGYDTQSYSVKNQFSQIVPNVQLKN